jgi:alkylation response protein AidB-like acyl-CoA dehydrogenase
MNFDLSDDQKLLVDTVASFVKKQSPVARARKLREDPVGWEKHVWRQMGQFGWLGVAFPEAAGGLGQSFVEAALILEQLGTTLSPEPLIPLLVAGTALLRAAGPEAAAKWLAPALEGTTSLAFANRDGRWVINGHAADHIVVADGDQLRVIDRAAANITPVQTMDGRKAAMITFQKAAATFENASAAIEEACDVGAAAACAEGAGIMRTVLAMTCDYLRTREQFGVKIGSFQALQHRAVDMFVETELSRSTAILAMLKVSAASADERRAAISAAKVQLAWGGRSVTQQAIQLHGGIGITDEADVGLYFKRMHVLNTLYGDEEHHLARFASTPDFTAGV